MANFKGIISISQFVKFYSEYSLKVLHVTNCYPYHGDPDYGIFVKRQIDSLRLEGLDQDVLFLNARDRGIFAYLDVWRYDFSSYDIIHCHHLFSFISVLVFAVLNKKPVVLSLLNEFGNEIKLPLPKNILAWVCKSTSRFATVCIYKSSLPCRRNRNLVYLPNGVDMEYFYPSSEKNHSNLQKKILFVSSKNPKRRQKRIDIFYQVISEINRRGGVLVEGVVASGLCPDDYRSLLQRCDLHLLCSEYEGSPNSVKEAMSCDVPVVSTDVGNVKKMFGDSDYYKVSSSSDVSVLASLCLEVLTRSKEMIDGRKLLIKSRLDLSSVAKRLLILYSEVLKERH